MKERRQLLRRNIPQSEIILWSKIRRKQIEGCRFRRQYSVGGYVLDFYCPELKLAIEVEGESHRRTIVKEYDNEREKQIKQLGIMILRFTNSNIGTKLDDVVKQIREVSVSLKASINFSPSEGENTKGVEK